MDYSPVRHLQLYRRFKAIDAVDYYGIIRYFERHEAALRSLEELQYFECAYRYAEALFAVEQYGPAIAMFDHLLELVFRWNLSHWEGQDVFAHLLRWKGLALLRRKEWAAAQHVLGEFVKVYPADRRGWRLLKGALLRQRPSYLRRCWAICTGFLFAALLAAAVELFAVRPFFRHYDAAVLTIHYALLGVGLLIPLSAEGWFYYRCCRKLLTFAHSPRTPVQFRK